MDYIVDLVERYNLLSGRIMLLIAGVVLALGLLQCFFGYRFFKLWATLTGALVFCVTMGLLGGMAAPDSLPVVGGMALAGMVLGAFVAFKLHKLGGFLVCGLTGAVLGYYIVGLPGLALGVVFGVLGMVFTRHAVAVSTSISGGLCAAYALSVLLSIDSMAVSLIITFIWTVIGVIFQLFLDGVKPAEQAAPDKKERAPAADKGSSRKVSSKGEEASRPTPPPADVGSGEPDDVLSEFAEGPASVAFDDFQFSPGAEQIVGGEPVSSAFSFAPQAESGFDSSFQPEPEKEWGEYEAEDGGFGPEPEGTAFTFAEPAAEQGFDFQPGDARNLCPHCGKENRSGTKFCSGCGKAMAQRRLCPSCGEEVEPDDRFCGQCGGILEQPEE